MRGELPGFAILLALITAFGIWHNRKGIREWLAREPARLGPSHTHRPADDASTGSAGRCHNCRRQVTGLAWVIVSDRLGGGVDRVCHGCSDTGMRKGWFRASLPEDANVYDVLVAQDSADLEQIDDLVEQWGQS